MRLVLHVNASRDKFICISRGYGTMTIIWFISHISTTHTLLLYTNHVWCKCVVQMCDANVWCKCVASVVGILRVVSHILFVTHYESYMNESQPPFLYLSCDTHVWHVSGASYRASLAHWKRFLLTHYNTLQHAATHSRGHRTRHHWRLERGDGGYHCHL